MFSVILMLRQADPRDLETPNRDSIPHHRNDDLLNARLAMLGLDRHVIERGDRASFDLIRQRCRSCACPETCAMDLQRDPNSPSWQCYCPNAQTLNALTEARWLAPMLTNYWRRHYP